MVTETENEFVVSSEYIQFLNSSVLVARAVLVSTQPCSVEGMRIDVNASIKELTGIVLLHYFTSFEPSLSLSGSKKCSVQTMKCIIYMPKVH